MKTARFSVASLLLLCVVTSGCFNKSSRQDTKGDLKRRGAKAYMAGDLPAAIEAKQEVVRLYPSDMVAQYDLAATLQKANRNAEAVVVFKKVAASKDATMSKAAQDRLKELEGK